MRNHVSVLLSRVNNRRTMQMRHALVWLIINLSALSSHAATFPGLYDTTVRVVERTDKARDAAFADAFGLVAVRVTGMRDAPERLGAALAGARRYVQKFGYTGDGYLDVGFDNVAVDQALAQAGLPVWGRERPSTLIWIVGDADPSSAQAAHDAAERTARLRGLPIIWPASEEGPAPGEPSEGSLAALAARYRADAVLVGRGSQAGVMRWSLTFGSQTNETQGTVDEGVGFAADTFAKIFATTSNAVSEVAMEVSGIDNLSAYAGALNYLEGLTLVRSTAVERVSGNTVLFRLVVRGDATTLRRAMSLDHRLVADATSSGSGMKFRYQP